MSIVAANSIFAGGAIWLSASGLFDPLSEAAAGEEKAAAMQDERPKPEPKADEPKPQDEAAAKEAKAEPAKRQSNADELKAKAQRGVEAAVEALVGAALNAFNRKPRVVEGVRDLVVDVVDEPALKQFGQQYGGQFRQLLRTELHFIRIVCRPTKPQYKQIATAGEDVLKSTIRTFAQVQQRMHRPMRAADRNNLPSNPRKVIAEGLMKSVKATLSAEQAARYRTELDRRAAAQKRVAVLNLLTKLDKDLVLTAEQRDKLGEILDANWQSDWGHMQMLMNIDNYCPQFPDSKVLPILSEHQKQVWRGMPKHGPVFFGFHGLGMVQGVAIEEEVWDEEQPQDLPDGPAKMRQ